MTLLASLCSALSGNADRGPLLAELLASPADSRLKLFATMLLLRARRTHPDLFQSGVYEPLAAAGARAAHVFAFRRRLDTQQVIFVVPRLVAGLSQKGDPPIGERLWADTEVRLPEPLPPHLRDRFTDRCVPVSDAERGARFRVADLFAAFPVAVLESA